MRAAMNAILYLLRTVLVQRRINHSRRNRIHTNTVFRIFDGEAACNRVNAALGNHWDRGIYACNRIIRQRSRDADDAPTRFLHQHLLDRELGYIDEAAKIGGN